MAGRPLRRPAPRPPRSWRPGRQVDGHLDGDLVCADGQRQPGDAGVLDERGRGAQGVRLGGQRPRRDQAGGGLAAARDGGGHDITSPPAVPPMGGTLVVALAGRMGTTLAKDAGPCKNAAAPPSPAAAGTCSRSVPAARMPLMVR